MVKFAEILESQAVPSWSVHYMSYNRLKRRREKCVYLRTTLLQIQAQNHKTPQYVGQDEDSDDEKVGDVITHNTQSTLEKIKKSHRMGRLSSVESRVRTCPHRDEMQTSVACAFHRHITTHPTPPPPHHTTGAPVSSQPEPDNPGEEGPPTTRNQK